MPPDYARLIGAETWAFIHETESWYPPETATCPIERQRGIYDAMCRAFHHGRPAGVAVEDRMIAGVPCRIYSPAKARGRATVVYFHGGGFVVGGLDSHDDVCAEICAGTGLGVVSADYRLAPEHTHPAAFDDAMAVAQEVGAQGPILLAGDSAGGNLAAAVAHRLRGSAVQVLGQVLIYPVLGGDRSRGSYITHARAPMLTRADVEYYAAIRHPGGAEPVGDPTTAPLEDTDFGSLPPTVAIAAECDPLADDAPDYAARIIAAGGKALARTDAGLVHGHLRARHRDPHAGAAFARVILAIGSLAQGVSPDRIPDMNQRSET